MSPTHHIRQYHLHVELRGPEAAGLALQRQLPGLCHDHLLPALERVLDRLASPDAHLVIGRLDVEVGTLDLSQLEQSAAVAVAQAVEKALREQTTQLSIGWRPAADIAQLKTAPQTVAEAFLHFLRTGRLPWAFRLPAGRTLEQTVWAAWREETGATGFRGHLREQLGRVLAAATARQRLLRQFSAAFWLQLLAALWPDASRQLESILTTLREAGPALAEALLAAFELRLWEAMLGKISENQLVETAELVGETWRQLPAAGRQPVLAGLLAYHWPGSTDATPTPEPGAAGAHLPLAVEVPARLEAEVPGDDDKDAAEGFYLDNAGLVLLHPFLSRFFDGLGLVENHQFRQPDRALALLHFLATGQRTAPEHELTLPKLLCAVPLPQPTVADVALTAAETDEAEALLRAVVRHWTALRSTSPAALRGTFLTRPGKLTHRPDGSWLLQVEPQSYDILLDQLPWGISLIQLPWMPQLLRVEWG